MRKRWYELRATDQFRRLIFAQAALVANGTLAALIKQWLGLGATLPA